MLPPLYVTVGTVGSVVSEYTTSVSLAADQFPAWSTDHTCILLSEFCTKSIFADQYPLPFVVVTAIGSLLLFQSLNCIVVFGSAYPSIVTCCQYFVILSVLLDPVSCKSIKFGSPGFDGAVASLYTVNRDYRKSCINLIGLKKLSS